MTSSEWLIDYVGDDWYQTRKLCKMLVGIGSRWQDAFDEVLSTFWISSTEHRENWLNFVEDETNADWRSNDNFDALLSSSWRSDRIFDILTTKKLSRALESSLQSEWRGRFVAFPRPSKEFMIWKSFFWSPSHSSIWCKKYCSFAFLIRLFRISQSFLYSIRSISLLDFLHSNALLRLILFWAKISSFIHGWDECSTTDKLFSGACLSRRPTRVSW